MKRRNFFKSIGAAVLGCYLGMGIKKFEPETFRMAIPNPKYYALDIEGVEYVMFAAWDKDAYKQIRVGPPPDVRSYTDLRKKLAELAEARAKKS